MAVLIQPNAAGGDEEEEEEAVAGFWGCALQVGLGGGGVTFPDLKVN